MTPGEIIRQAVIDESVELVEGEHDGIGDAAIEALDAAGWSVVRLGEAVVVAGELYYRVQETAR